MSTKRTSTESCDSAAEEQILNDGAAAVFHQDDNAKRARLTAFYDTMLEDLPIELIECILIKVVVMEVKSTKLAKSVWKEKAELVINRLADVSSQWSYVLSTDGFRTRLHRALEAEAATRVEILQRHTMQSLVSDVTALKDEVFMLCRRHHDQHKIKVYDRNNMAEVKDVIPLPGLNPDRIFACAVSNCVYILNGKIYNHHSILCITKDSNNRWSTVSELISELNLPKGSFCVGVDGSLIISRQQTKRFPAISVYDATGSVQQKLWLPSDIAEISDIIPKPNGNLVLRGLADDNDDNDDDDDNDDYRRSYRRDRLTEIDMTGAKIRQHLCSLGGFSILRLRLSIDSDGRMMTVSDRKGVRLLDSEFNLMDDVTGPLQFDVSLQSQFTFTNVLFHYDSERNETIFIDQNLLTKSCTVTVFQLKDL